jgi:hypothetical protein
MSEPRASYTSRRDATPEIEVAALAAVYKFVLDCRAPKEAAPESRPSDARKDKDAGTYHHST